MSAQGAGNASSVCTAPVDGHGRQLHWPKLRRQSEGLSPETTRAAPTGVPDLRAASQAGCRLLLPSSSLWISARRELLSCSLVSPMTAGSSPSASRRRLMTAKLSSRGKVVALSAPGDHGRWGAAAGGGGSWLRVCPLAADAAATAQPCHRNVFGETAPPNDRGWEHRGGPSVLTYSALCWETCCSSTKRFCQKQC